MERTLSYESVWGNYNFDKNVLSFTQRSSEFNSDKDDIYGTSKLITNKFNEKIH
jgi:hypothetical protein